MSPADAAMLVGSLVQVAKEAPAVLEQIHAWVSGNGERPAELPELPDLTINHLEQAAFEARARKAAGGA